MYQGSQIWNSAYPRIKLLFKPLLFLMQLAGTNKV
jgi:hypothetical protein